MVYTLKQVAFNGRFLVQSLSGVQRFSHEITRALAERWPNDVCAPPILLAPKSGDNTSIESSGGLTVKTGGRFGGHLWEQLSLPRLARGSLLVNFGNTAPILPPLLGGRQIVVIHDAGAFSTPYSYSRAFRIVYRTMHRALALGRTRIVTVSCFARDDIARHLRIDPSHIDVIPEGADHATQTTPDETILHRYNLSLGRYVLAVGNNAPHKDFPALADLAAKLAHDGLKLVISGGVDHRVFGAGGEALAQATYVGRVSDAELHALYRGAGCFVFPSIYEGFGLPPVEAMACGCPVVARDIPVLREVCGDGALYGATGSDLTKRVYEVLDSPRVSQRLKEAGAAIAARYRWEHAAEALLSIIKEELGA